jgi:transcription elongation factor Elf1
MAKIHHNTLKKAAAHGLFIHHEDGAFRVFSKDGADTAKALASAADPKDALDLAILALNPPKAKKAPAAAKAPAKKRKAKKAPKFTCENCGHHKRVKSDDEDGGYVCAECSEDASLPEDEEGASVVKKLYKTRYKPHKHKNGDDIGKKVSEHVSRHDEEAGGMRIDYDLLVKFAKANGVWDPNYAGLKNRDGSRNVGMMRMNVCNRLRGKIRRDKHVVVWG